ncbi:hypothetical protein D9613_001873 [Agrocybe pediades]|uniref:Mediator of RNA polymerase II transcription subunit 5 n=1 Tax=Agrocybe pediades TaxID=84607 RepID=A0A8H4R3X6_9AGAR|nr:hypothetical protein D9613_001873 [Agrocybe pediades]
MFTPNNTLFYRYRNKSLLFLRDLPPVSLPARYQTVLWHIHLERKRSQIVSIPQRFPDLIWASSCVETVGHGRLPIISKSLKLIVIAETSAPFTEFDGSFLPLFIYIYHPQGLPLNQKMDPSVLPLVLNFDYYNIDLSVPQQDDSNVYSAPYDSQLYDAGEPLLKLHAPVPLAGSMPQLLQPDYHDCSESSSPNQPPSGSSCTAVEDYQACDVAHLKVDERHGSPIEMGKYSVEYGHTTFPTPSELLAELAAKGLPATNDEFGSDVRTESASKARRRIMAKKIGFVPTDPPASQRHIELLLEQWLALSKLLIEKIPPLQLEGMGQVATNISSASDFFTFIRLEPPTSSDFFSSTDSVLVLYRSYPGDPALQEYLKAALQDGILPVSTFVTTLLQAARSPDLHVPVTLDTLCRTALDAHYSSGLPPVGSVVALNESPLVTLGTIQDALALLRTAYSLPISHFHQLTTSVSELVILLVSCISDLSQVSPAQALVHFADANELLTNYRLTADVRQVLDALVISLSLLIGDDVKAAREAQLMQTVRYSLGSKGPGGEVLGGPSSDSDVITFGLLLNHLLLVSAFTCIAQPNNNARLWKAFVVGRLPTLISSIKPVMNGDNSAKSDFSGALEAALTVVYRRPDIIVQSDQAISREGGSELVTEEERLIGTYANSARSFSREFLQQLIKHGLLTQQAASQLDPMVSNESLPKWHVEAQDSGLELSAYIEAKIMQDSGNDNEVRVWVDRIWRDASSHQTFANLVHKRFSTLTTSEPLDIDSMGQLCKVLHMCDNALDIVSLHEPIEDLLFYALVCLEDYDCETVGDPQTAFENRELSREGRTVTPGYLLNTDAVPRHLDRGQADLATAWTKAVFVNSEGIEDNILRSTNPKVLVRIAPAIIIQAIQYAIAAQKIDKDALMNGVSYFTGPLLNWTLVGVIKALIKDVQQKHFLAPVHYEIIQSLILSSSCPKSVLALCSPQILALISDKKRQPPSGPPNSFNIPALRQKLAETIGIKGGGDSLFANSSTAQISHQQLQQAIQRAFSLARSHKPPSLDVRRCLKTVSPIKFVQLLWGELSVAASSGETETCRRIATFVLAVPQDSTIPPLLPIFMHFVLPALIATADRKQNPEQTMDTELLVSIVSSVLNAAVHLEWAMRGIPDGRLALGQSSNAIARRLSLDLRRNRRSPVSGIIFQRLSSSPSFVANFPAFINDLGT